MTCILARRRRAELEFTVYDHSSDDPARWRLRKFSLRSDAEPHSPAAVLLDANKQVVYARDQRDRVVARQIVSIARDESFVAQAVYPECDDAMAEIFSTFDQGYAKKKRTAPRFSGNWRLLSKSICADHPDEVAAYVHSCELARAGGPSPTPRPRQLNIPEYAGIARHTRGDKVYPGTMKRLCPHRRNLEVPQIASALALTLICATACDGRGDPQSEASDTADDSSTSSSSSESTGGDDSATTTASSDDSASSTATSSGESGTASESESESSSGTTTGTTSGTASDESGDTTDGTDTGEDPDEATCGREPPPGPYVVSGDAVGSKACEGQRLADFIARTHEQFPDLSDIDIIFDPNGDGIDGSYIHAYAKADEGGFALAFARGWGNCESGCIDHEWTYIESDADCAPTAAGHYRPQWQQDPKCLQIEGTPRWNNPVAPDPITVCGEDQSPRDISGDHPAHIRGTWQPCTELGPDEPKQELDADIRVVIQQDSKDMAKGTIELVGLEHERMGRAFDATFERQRGHVLFHDSQSLPNEFTVDMTIDLEGCIVPELRVSEIIEFDDGDYCKGSISANIRILPE